MGNFMGKDGFIWFMGVVEDRLDPKAIGRLRVRCLGYHTHNALKLPTKDLPWAHVMNPITSATISGVGQSPIGAVEGTWVMGFFRDGVAAQEPVIIGTLPGIPSYLPEKKTYTWTDDKGDFNQTVGFYDGKYNYPKYKNETDVNRLAVNEGSTLTGGIETNPHSALTIRRADRDLGVSVADIESIDSIAGIGDPVVALDLGGVWSEPVTPYRAVYPYNHVYESEGGHIREMDDTPGYERIHERHASGSGYEIFPDGTKVTRVKKDNYSITTANDYVHIQGDSSSTVDGGVRVFINKDRTSDNNYNIQVGDNAHVTIQVDGGDINLIAYGDDINKGNINLKAKGSIAIEADSGIYTKANLYKAEIGSGGWTEIVSGTNTKTGSTINLN